MAIKKLADFHRRLHRWYQAEGRAHLPWRHDVDAYRIYISEIMLQQTQVATVLDRYYHPFLKRFPTLAALANAPVADVLKAWEGLGYYTRARNLHKAAQQANGTLPSTIEELIALPGIGKNTAHAIAAFAYRQSVPVMEANVKRILCRIFALKQPDDKTLWNHAAELFDTQNSFDYNQAMMDLGSLVCTKTKPRCHACPASIICAGKISPQAYPDARKKKQPPLRQKNIVLLHTKDGRYYLEPRTSRHLGGLFGFPEFDSGVNEVSIHNHTHRLIHKAKLGQVTMKYSHFTLLADVYHLPAITTKTNLGGWFKLNEIKTLNISRLESALLELLK